MNPAHKQFVLILRISCMLLFLGRGWQHFFWDAPFRTILWDQELLSWFIEGFTGMTWQEYVTSPSTDQFINLITKSFGAFYFFLSGFCLTLQASQVKRGRFLLAGSACLGLLFIIKFIGKNYAIGMLIEHATQFGVPLVLYTALYKENYFEKYLNFYKVLIAFTFIGHGLFAVGFHPVPGKFVDMIISVFGFSEENAYIMLKIAGTLDFIAAASLFIQPFVLYALVFNVFWGIVTAFARVVAHFDIDLAQMSAHQWILETIYRLPHGLLPLALLITLWKMNPVNNSKA